jgi:hypothetical protein
MEGAAMLVRLRSLEKRSRHDYRLTLDVVDPQRLPWDYGDAVVRVDLHDAMGQHCSAARGILRPALELYRLSPEEPPQTTEAKLLWDMGQAVHHYVERIFAAGIICPFGPPAKEDAPERKE